MLITMRIPQKTKDEIHKSLAKFQTRSHWIREAITEKLKKGEMRKSTSKFLS